MENTIEQLVFLHIKEITMFFLALGMLFLVLFDINGGIKVLLGAVIGYYFGREKKEIELEKALT